MTTFIDTVLAIAFMEVIVKPITIRITKHILRWADDHIELIPDWLYTSKQED